MHLFQPTGTVAAKRGRQKNGTSSLRRQTTFVLAAVLASRLAVAQTADTASQKTFFVPRDGAVAAAFLAVSAGLTVFDSRIARFFADTALSHVRTGQRLDDIFTRVNESTLTVGSLAVYAVARVAKQETVADIAFHTATSVFAASVSAQLIRGPLGRTRPNDLIPPFRDQYDFHFMKGFSSFEQRAFPSIHSASGFAAASALVAETKHRKPGAMWYVAIPAYAIALTPGLSRMYLGEHWASDIFAGAFFGTFYGWRIVEYSHSHRRSRFERIFLGSSAGGRQIGWTVDF
jgi:membrane-associated phospholipid phosphatase